MVNLGLGGQPVFPAVGNIHLMQSAPVRIDLVDLAVALGACHVSEVLQDKTAFRAFMFHGDCSCGIVGDPERAYKGTTAMSIRLPNGISVQPLTDKDGNWLHMDAIKALGEIPADDLNVLALKDGTGCAFVDTEPGKELSSEARDARDFLRDVLSSHFRRKQAKEHESQ
jgi:hypothetical protein